jgi:hypothetical protein
MKKMLVLTLLFFGSSVFASGGVNIYSGFSYLPGAEYRFADSSTVSTGTLFGTNLGLMKIFGNNFIIGASIEGVLGKIKDKYNWADWTDSITLEADGGYRFGFQMPVDVYAILGYRWAKLNTAHSTGPGYGAGIAVNIESLRPVIEYTFFKMNVDGLKYDDSRITFDLDFTK